MKESLLASPISSAFFLSACYEKDIQALNEKLQQAEQTITQLNQDLAKAQQDLTALQAEQSKLQAQLPALDVTIEPLFSKSERVKLPAANDSERTEGWLDYFASIAKTGLDWLDNLLIRHTLLNHDGKINHQVTGTEKEEALKLIEKNYQDSKTALREYGDITVCEISQMEYVGQRGNIATFIQSWWYNYTDSGCGFYGTNCFNVDLNKKIVISLDSLMSKAHQEQAKAILWNSYLEKTRMEAQDEKAEPFTPKITFDLVDNFYFTYEGINFVYPADALAPFVEVTLTLSWNNANKLVSSDYQRTKKDGVGLASEEE